MSNTIALFSAGQGFMAIDGSNSYLTPIDPNFFNHLINQNLWSNEDGILNWLYNKYREIGSNKNFIDIGANVGTYTMYLGDLFNHTYAFEPYTHAYNCMCGNIAIKDLSHKVTAYNTGLYYKKDVLKFSFTDLMGSNNFFTTDDAETNDALANDLSCCYTTLEVNTLDSYGIQDVGLIKIDTEGTELQVLQGAVETIKNNEYPELIVESWNPVERAEVSGNSVESLEKLRSSLFNFIRDIGYTYITQLEHDVFSCEKSKK